MNISTFLGDITKLKVDVVVNAANQYLMGGGGVDGAIHRAAGPELLSECRSLGGCSVGNAKLTKAYSLPAKHIIHAVGPRWMGGNKDESKLLASCYHVSIDLAKKVGAKSIAFPSISTGVYRYPPHLAAKVAVSSVIEASDGETSIQEVIFCCYTQSDLETYLAAIGHQNK